MKCTVIANKKVLYIPAEMSPLFVQGRYYGVIVQGKIIALRCIRTAGRKVLLVPSQFYELFQIGNDYVVAPYNLEKL